jgi:hypothetical protein
MSSILTHDLLPFVSGKPFGPGKVVFFHHLDKAGPAIRDHLLISWSYPPLGNVNIRMSIAIEVAYSYGGIFESMIFFKAAIFIRLKSPF